ncbi:hypothetical protein PF007_g19747 [Phytophthora fragariae]|uniref:Uncharacterized protein n=1 Tax=Phytophthora fragariae TaxID=53985 RepID=A0A6A3R3R2_9STRA|nr:hypothetical protein PF007_g19747 [Phytophthora fragariae]
MHCSLPTRSGSIASIPTIHLVGAWGLRKGISQTRDPLDSRFPKQGPADPTWVTSLLTNGLDGAEVRADQSLTVYQALDADLCQELDEQRAARSWTSTSKLDADIELDCNNQRARQELDADLERGDGKLYTHIQLQGLRPRSWPLRNALVCAQVEEVNRSKSSRPGSLQRWPPKLRANPPLLPVLDEFNAAGEVKYVRTGSVGSNDDESVDKISFSNGDWSSTTSA